MITLALVPPNPNELFSAARTLTLLGLVRHQIDTLRALVGIVEVERRRHDLIADRKDAEDRLDRACPAEQVSDRDFVLLIEAPDRSSPSTRLTAASSMVSAMVEVPWALT
jgi:hypothetical protein